MATIKLGTVPGVYIQEEVNPALAITEQRLKAAGLVGHATPTLNINNHAVTRSAEGDTDTLEYAAGNVVEVYCISDYVNAYGSNLPQYNQHPGDTAPAEPQYPVLPEKPVEPGHDASEEDIKSYKEAKAEYDAVEAEIARMRAEYEAAVAEYEHAIEVADYKIVDGNKIKWLHPDTLAGEDDAPLAPVRGATYYVTLKIKKDASYYEAKVFDDLDAIEAFYGPACYYNEEAGKWVLNEITAAARIMFTNGANVMYICEVVPGAVDPETHLPSVSTRNVQTAVKKLSEYEIQTIVCIPQNEAIQKMLAKQVVIDSATENGKERVAWVAALDDAPDAVVEQSKSFKEQRIVNIAPSKVTLLVEDAEGTSHEFPGESSIYAAAALTGITTNNNRTVAEPLTRENPAGIYGLSREYIRSEVEKMSAAGTTVLVTRNAAVTVNQAVTTDNTNQNNRELSVVLIKDEVMKTIRYNLDKEFIGHFYDRNKTPTAIKTSIMLMLDDMIGTLVQDYDQSNIIVTPDDQDTTRVNVKMAFAVLRPLNYIYISFMVTI